MDKGGIMADLLAYAQPVDREVVLEHPRYRWRGRRWPAVTRDSRAMRNDDA